jgi:hypothetical protein
MKAWHPAMSDIPPIRTTPPELAFMPFSEHVKKLDTFFLVATVNDRHRHLTPTIRWKCLPEAIRLWPSGQLINCSFLPVERLGQGIALVWAKFKSVPIVYLLSQVLELMRHVG